MRSIMLTGGERAKTLIKAALPEATRRQIRHQQQRAIYVFSILKNFLRGSRRRELNISSPHFERIDNNPRFDGPIRESHEYRYKVAGRYTTDHDIVIDAACGSGYGQEFLRGKYIGVDIITGINLNTWIPDFEYDVFVTLETIEHLDSFTQLVKNAKKARKYIIVSAPTIPTVGSNPYHKHDFTHEGLRALFEDDNWRVIHEEKQKDIRGEKDTYGIFVLERFR